MVVAPCTVVLPPLPLLRSSLSGTDSLLFQFSFCLLPTIYPIPFFSLCSIFTSSNSSSSQLTCWTTPDHLFLSPPAASSLPGMFLLPALACAYSKVTRSESGFSGCLLFIYVSASGRRYLLATIFRHHAVSASVVRLRAGQFACLLNIIIFKQNALRYERGTFLVFQVSHYVCIPNFDPLK